MLPDRSTVRVISVLIYAGDAGVADLQIAACWIEPDERAQRAGDRAERKPEHLDHAAERSRVDAFLAVRIGLGRPRGGGARIDFARGAGVTGSARIPRPCSADSRFELPRSRASARWVSWRST